MMSFEWINHVVLYDLYAEVDIFSLPKTPFFERVSKDPLTKAVSWKKKNVFYFRPV